MIDFDNTIENFSMNDFSNTLHDFLNSNDTQLYSLDRIENDIGVLENRTTGNILEVSTSELPDDIKDGDIFSFFNGVFEKDENKFNEILGNIDSLRKDVTIKN